MATVNNTPSALDRAREQFANSKPDPVFVAALECLSYGAPGLSDLTREAIARAIAIKVAHAAKVTGERA